MRRRILLNEDVQYLEFVVTNGGSISFNASTEANALSYSMDKGKTWSETNGDIQVSSGDSVMWKGNASPINNKGIGNFSGDSNVRYDVRGNIMSLLYGDDFRDKTSLEGKNYTFYGLFSGNTNVVSAKKLLLQATTLAETCYSHMFSGCTSLTEAPSELPATTLPSSCYQKMFYGCTSLTEAPKLLATKLNWYCCYQMFQFCTSLTTAPQLQATTLATSCYDSMFRGCTSLTEAPELPTTTLVGSCYYCMFLGCTSLVTAPQLPATTLKYSCYEAMFNGCTSLETAPQLPATTLASSCYRDMFQGCTSLNSIICLATDISASNCTSNWVDGVAANGTFTKAASMSSWTSGSNGIPSGWSVVDA